MRSLDDAHTLTVSCPQGQLRARRTEVNHQVGESITVVVPADKIRMEPTTHTDNHLTATLRGREFMGSQVSYLLETESGYEVTIICQESFSESLKIDINTELSLHWSSHDTVLLGEARSPEDEP